MRIVTLSALAAIAAAPAFAAPATDIQHMKYSCDGNAVLEVVYVTPATGDNYAIVLEQDELLPMAQVKSASGAVYSAISPDYHYQLLTKGGEATLVATTNGKEEPVKSNCKG